jgi:hypothetical protein
MHIFVLTATYELSIRRKSHLGDHPTGCDCAPFHHQQCGSQGVTLSTSSSMDVRGVWVYLQYFHPRMDVQGVSLSTASSVNMLGVSLSSTSSVGTQGASFSVTISMNVPPHRQLCRQAGFFFCLLTVVEAS